MEAEVAKCDVDLEHSGGKSLGAFKCVCVCYFLSILFVGAGNYLFNQKLPTNLYVVFIFAAFFIQVWRCEIRVPAFLQWLFVVVLFWTFVLNYTAGLAIGSLVHFVGLVLFSITAFSFVVVNKHRMFDIAYLYYYFCFAIACFAIAQVVVFVVFGYDLSLNAIIMSSAGSSMKVENFGFLPRARSIVSEPAAYATLALPGAYLALLVLFGKAKSMGLCNRYAASVLLLGYLLSVSMVGLFGLLLAAAQIFLPLLRRARLGTLIIAVGVCVGGGALVSQLSTFHKLDRLTEEVQDVSNFEYTTNDLSGFALISNALVAKETLFDSNFLGTGLNTHEQDYDKYMGTLFTNDQVIMELNKSDGGSLFIRLTSEFGLLGLLGFLFFLVRYKLWSQRYNPRCRIVNDISLVYLFVYAARTGQYLDPVLWLFVALFYCSNVEARISASATMPDQTQPAAP